MQTHYVDNKDGRTVKVELYSGSGESYRPECARIQMSLSWKPMHDHDGFQTFPAYLAEDMLGRTTALCMHYGYGEDNTWSTVSAEAMSEISDIIKTWNPPKGKHY